MSELLNPITTKNSFFLTLSQYNDEETRFQDARVELHKSSKILDSTGAYLAAESFKISVGGQGGIEYLTIPTDWRILAEKQTSEGDVAPVAGPGQIQLVCQPFPDCDDDYSDDDMEDDTLVGSFNGALIKGYEDLEDAEDLDAVTDMWAKEQMTEFYCAGRSIFTKGAETDEWKMTRNAYIHGSGLFHGTRMRGLPCSIVVNEQNNTEINGKVIPYYQLTVTYLKSRNFKNDDGVPLMFQDFKEILCRGYKAEADMNSDEVKNEGNPGRYKMRSTPPHFFAYEDESPGGSISQADKGKNFAQIAGPRLSYVTATAGTIFLEIDVPGKAQAESKLIGPDGMYVIWKEDGTVFTTGDNVHIAEPYHAGHHSYEYFGTGRLVHQADQSFLDFNDRYEYRCTAYYGEVAMNLGDKYRGYIRYSDIPVGPVGAGAGPGAYSINFPVTCTERNTEVEQDPPEGAQGGQPLLRRPGGSIQHVTSHEFGVDEPTPVYNLNELLNAFNLPSKSTSGFEVFADLKNFFEFKMGPGGGFKIEFISPDAGLVPDAYSGGKMGEYQPNNFSITQVMSEALGLDAYITRAQEQTQPEKVTIIMHTRPSANNGNAVGHLDFQPTDVDAYTFWLPQTVPITPAGGSTAHNTTIRGCTVSDTSDNILEKVFDAVGRVVLKAPDGSYAQAISYNSKRQIRKKIVKVREAPIVTTQNGLTWYKYVNVVGGDFIPSLHTVNVESLSTYESIQIVSHSGMLYQPQISRSSGFNRVLCSYRLPFIFSAVNNVYGEVTAVENAFYSDLLYNIDGGGSQYLKLTSPGPQYDLALLAQLVPRNRALAPKTIKLPPKGIFEVKLRFVINK